MTGSDGLLFLFDDGVTPMLTPGPNDPRYSVFEAPAVWDQVRAQVWLSPLRGLWAPMGSLKYDHVTELTRAQRPVGPYNGHVWTVERVREAVQADIASVDAFRKAKPAAAATIDDELDRYVEDVRVLLGIAERFGDALDEMGWPRAAANGWTAYEKRRRDEAFA